MVFLLWLAWYQIHQIIGILLSDSMLNFIVNPIQSMIANDSQTNMLNAFQKVDNDGEAIS